MAIANLGLTPNTGPIMPNGILAAPKSIRRTPWMISLTDPAMALAKPPIPGRELFRRLWRIVLREPWLELFCASGDRIEDITEE